MDNKKTHDINVLIVDGKQELADHLATFLSQKGYSPITVSSGVDALEALKHNFIQIAVIDHSVPDIDGLTLLEAIKTNYKRILVVVASSHATIDAAAKSIKGGAYDFISKPYQLVELELIMRRAMEKMKITERLRRSRIRNIVLALSLPLWTLIGYYLVSYFKCL